MNTEWNFSTKVIHHKKTLNESSNAVSQPVIPAVAYAFSSADEAAATVTGEREGIYYGRYGNPTTEQLEDKIAILENAEAALGVSSGMAAIANALLAVLSQGDHIVITKDVYGGTHKFMTSFASRYGISYDFVDCSHLHMLESAIQHHTKAIYIETPSNPSLTVLDIEEIAHIAQKYSIPLIVDNTFMTPYLQKPIDLGADIVVHSATKYLNGHGDVVAGFVCGTKSMIHKMRKNIMGDLGQNLNAWEAFLILRGLKTLGIRIDRHCKTAFEIAKFLESHPAVTRVYYPGLCSHPQFDIAQKQMKNNGGIVSFEVQGGVENGKKFINELQLAFISFSLGDPETLVQHPASMTHSSIPENRLNEFGISKGLIRLSAGLEDAEDIIKDLDQALATLIPELI
ncbi:MAG TPA: aminotransferase class I/II-fold pyridoxal phosphate-dependent enzyme [Candidatus Dormibacteraeota bacterium]|nr:aminotransferase class I/II-fold pyridoxal phosphate-dependent enzyme [Candidatus Dormibacteraeota bacterium]